MNILLQVTIYFTKEIRKLIYRTYKIMAKALANLAPWPYTHILHDMEAGEDAKK